MKPFTYLIGWSSLNAFYYGVRYKKNCDPRDLWTTYKTSSQKVKHFVEINGDPDIIQIRRTFSSPNEARRWEAKVLSRLVYKNPKIFLNEFFKAKPSNLYKEMVWVTKDYKSRMVPLTFLEDYTTNGWQRGRTFSEDHRKKNSEGVKAFLSKNGSPHLGMKRSEASRQLMKNSNKGKGRTWSPEARTKRMKSFMNRKPTNTRPITYDGVSYPSLKEASTATGLSSYLLLKSTIRHD